MLRAAWSGDDARERAAPAGKIVVYSILVLILVAISNEYFLGYIVALKFRVLLQYYENSLL